ncbi:MAG: ANTAR domain-containing protein [Pseudomonadota bacterium]
MHIVVVDPDRERAFQIVDGLSVDSSLRVTVLGDIDGIARKLTSLDPDVILIDLADPKRDHFEQTLNAVGATDRPVAMFVDKSDIGMTKAAIEAGVSAYVVDGLKKERVLPIIEMAVARFREFDRIKKERDAANEALAERKVVDRAKGILMKAKGLSEEEAYSLLRKTAMDQGRKIGEVSEGIVTAAGLLS